jgi:hypothetical protein
MPAALLLRFSTLQRAKEQAWLVRRTMASCMHETIEQAKATQCHEPLHCCTCSQQQPHRSHTCNLQISHSLINDGGQIIVLPSRLKDLIHVCTDVPASTHVLQGRQLPWWSCCCMRCFKRCRYVCSNCARVMDYAQCMPACPVVPGHSFITLSDAHQSEYPLKESSACAS